MRALGGLVAARICHDLVGPVGAIANGVDLMAEIGGGAEGEEVALVRQSTARASALLRVLRLAFGQASAEGQPVARDRLGAELGEAVAGRRVVFALTGGEGPALRPTTARLAALMVLSGRRLLGLSGQLELVLSREADLPIRMTASGGKAAIPVEAAAWLAGDLSAMPSSRDVELALAPHAAAEAGARLAWHADDGSVTLCAVAPR
jgi:histidine phosphotransferase ChpT